MKKVIITLSLQIGNEPVSGLLQSSELCYTYELYDYTPDHRPKGISLMYSFNNSHTLDDSYYPEDHYTFSDPFDRRDFTMKNTGN